MKISHASLSVLCLCVAAITLAQQIDALPAIVSRATDSISALLASGRPAIGQQSQQQQLEPRAFINSSSGVAPPPPSQVFPAPAPQAQEPQQQQQQPQPNPVIQHLNLMQNQAQRLNGLVLSGANQLVNSAPATLANLTQATGAKYGNMLEVLSNVGKAIQQQIMGQPNVQIISSPGMPQVNANSKKNEYQSIVVSDNQPLILGATNNNQPALNGTNYREQGEQLRQEIVRRAGQLQQVVASSMEVLKNNGDMIVRRLLEQMNHRLDQAKSKADKIINEPATNEMGVKALNTINQGLNNLNNIITNIVNRLDISAKEAIQAQQMNNSQRVAIGGPNSLLDPNRIRQNLQQLGQQFSSVISAAQQQQKQQQQQLASVQQLQQQQAQKIN